MGRLDFAGVLANPVVAFFLRVALGSYIIFMARGFYADPLGYFRRWMPRLPDLQWMRQSVRSGAVFCVWGGSFIVATAVATQILGLHGTVWAFVLMALAACATYFLLPGEPGNLAPGSSEDDRVRRLK
jgi:hypothetical protein